MSLLQVSQDRGGDDALRLIRSKLVVFSAGPVLVAGAVDGVGSLGSPDGAPGRESQPGLALAGEFGSADERAGQVLCSSSGACSMTPCRTVSSIAGLRRSEIMGLRWSDIDLQPGRSPSCAV